MIVLEPSAIATILDNSCTSVDVEGIQEKWYAPIFNVNSPSDEIKPLVNMITCSCAPKFR